MSLQPLILPQQRNATSALHQGDLDSKASERISAWLRERISTIRQTWLAKQSDSRVPDRESELEVRVDQLLRILLHRTFNHQSRGRLQQILPAIRSTIETKVAHGRPIAFFLLYNGGYRASPFPDGHGLIFQPDQTELLLLLQISLLQQKIEAVYPPGIEFSIVINNGVAWWVNDIPLEATENYVARLRNLIRACGAGQRIQLFVQSEMPGFRLDSEFPAIHSVPPLNPVDHSIVERFLGRSCSEQEARERFTRYTPAESRWAEQLAPVLKEKDAIPLRQVAHPEMLSFRPFPGGAIRAQNGTVGFVEQNGGLVPRLLTSENFRRYVVIPTEPIHRLIPGPGFQQIPCKAE